MRSTKRLAVIGNPVNHSLSPKIHKIFAEQLDIEISYEAICLDEDNFIPTVRRYFAEGYHGFNVTLPFKELAYELADHLSKDSELCGSVNTLWSDGSLISADTTDGRGLIEDLRKKSLSIKNKEIVVLGAGGSTRAIIPSLLEASPKRLSIGNRTISKAEKLAERFSSIDSNINIFSMSGNLDFQPDLVINTTSAGILGQDLELPKNLFNDQTNVYDLSYAPVKTPFLDLAKSLGAKNCFDGLGMLIEQAALSFEIWTNQKPNTSIDKKLIL